MAACTPHRAMALGGQECGRPGVSGDRTGQGVDPPTETVRRCPKECGKHPPLPLIHSPNSFPSHATVSGASREERWTASVYWADTISKDGIDPSPGHPSIPLSVDRRCHAGRGEMEREEVLASCTVIVPFFPFFASSVRGVVDSMAAPDVGEASGESWEKERMGEDTTRW